MDLHVQHEIAECIYQLATHEFINGRFLGIASSFNMSQTAAIVEQMVIERLHATNRWLIQVVTNDEDKPIPNRKLDTMEKVPAHRDFPSKRKNNHYVIIVDTWQRFKLKMKDIFRSLSFNPSAHFLIFIQQITDGKNAQKVLEYLWKNQCINSIILIQMARNSSSLNLYILNVYNPAKICGTNNTSEIVGTCINTKLLPNSTFFYTDRVPNDSHRCTIQAIAMTWPPFVIDINAEMDAGMEINVVKTIADHFNLTVNFTQSDQEWGDRYKNGTWGGLFSKIQKKEASIGVGNIFSDQRIYEDFYISTPYFQACVGWFVPVAKRMPRWRTILLIFRLSLWISLVITLLAVAISWYCLAWYTSHDIQLRSIGLCILNGMCIVFGIGNPTRPIASLIRVFFLVGSIYGLHISALYQASLIRIISTPPKEHQITNVDELVKSSLEFGGIPLFRVFYNESDDPISEYIYNNYRSDEENATLYYYLHKVTSTRRFATLANKFYFDFYVSRGDKSVCDETACPAIYGFKQNVLCYTTSMVTEKGFPYIFRINGVLTRFQESGILNKWNDDTVTIMKRTEARRIKNHRLFVLSFQHLEGAFGLLFLGVILAVLVFGIEIFTFSCFSYNNIGARRVRNKFWRKFW